LTTQLSAQTNYTLTNSAWNNPAGWTPSYPGTTVAAGNTITITGNCNIPSGVIVNVSCDVDIVHHGFSLFGTAEYHQLAGTLTLGPHTTVNNIWQGPINEIAAGATFVNEGEVRLGNSGVTNLDGEIIINGSIASNQFNSSGNNVVSNVTGNVSGTGGYNGANSGASTTFSGTVSPGEGGIGCLGFFPTVQTTTAVTNIEANGTTPCTEHDRITGVNGGDFAPAGTLNFTVNYTPVDGDAVHFYSNTNSMITGAYDAVNAPAGWAIEYNSPSNGNMSMVFDESTVGPPAVNVCATPAVNINPAAGGATLTDFGQTFHAGDCGPLTNIAVHTKFNSAQNNGIFQLYSGQSVDAADLLYEVAVTPSETTVGWEKIYYDLTGGTGNNVVVEGQEYTWRLDLGNTIPYGEVALLTGQAHYIQGNFATTNDFQFYFEFNNAPPPVPTMGEWALITFGLIIMSMGVITVRRREQNLIVKAA